MGGGEGQFTANGGDNLQPSDVESSAVIVYFYDGLVCEVFWTTVSVEGGEGERAGSSGGQGWATGGAHVGHMWVARACCPHLTHTWPTR